MAQKKKFYVVRCGHQPGIYRSWEECRIHVDGYSGADYRAFSLLKDAEDYLKNGVTRPEPPSTEQNDADNVAATSTVPPAAVGKRVSSRHVVIYTDGACTGNPGPGGYGVVLVHGIERKELAAGFRLTTNNRMEILGCIAALQALGEPCRVT